MIERLKHPTRLVLIMLAGDIFLLHLLHVHSNMLLASVLDQPFQYIFLIIPLVYFLLGLFIYSIPVAVTMLTTLILVRRVKWRMEIIPIELVLAINAFLQSGKAMATFSTGADSDLQFLRLVKSATTGIFLITFSLLIHCR
ncbi:MAG: hypothetical protein MZV65_38340 [Chromatiales bacterium]|nr:hypothetical protein [Chromatiales bacterium]